MNSPDLTESNNGRVKCPTEENLTMPQSRNEKKSDWDSRLGNVHDQRAFHRFVEELMSAIRENRNDFNAPRTEALLDVMAGVIEPDNNPDWNRIAEHLLYLLRGSD